MTRKVLLGLAVWGAAFGTTAAHGQLIGTEFTYQGFLERLGSPLAGSCDLQFTLYDLNGPVAGPQAVPNWPIVNGVFTVQLDFGAEVFTGDRWIETVVRCPPGVGAYTTLTPRQPVTATPYALQTRGLHVNNAGDVGIGTTNPGEGFGAGRILHIVGDDVNGRAMVGLENSVVTGQKFEIGAYDGKEFGIIDRGTQALPLANNFFRAFGTNPTNTMVLKDGNVGIGTTDPNSMLDVAGDVEISHTATGDGALKFKRGANQFANAEVRSHGSTSGLNEDLGFYTGEGDAQSGPPQLRMIIASDGNVGIGTAIPQQILHLKSTAPSIMLENAARAWRLYSDNAPDAIRLHDETLGLTRVAVTGQTGNVGIGTTTPGYKLEVVGTTAIHGVTDNPNNAGTLRVDGHDNQLMFRQTGSPDIANQQASIVYNAYDNLPQAGGIVFQRRSGVGEATPGEFEANLVAIRVDNGWVRISPPIGGVGAAHPLVVGSNATDGNGAHCTTGGVWTNGSDRNSKQKFEEIDRREILRRVADLPVTRWQYKGEPDHVRHIGPVAQDFYAAFGTGEDDRFIGTIDADGVALAAIQGLHDIVQDKDCEIDELREENRDFKDRLAALEAMVARLAVERTGGGQ